MLFKTVPIIDLKVQEDGNGKFYLTGYANTKGVEDSYGDIPTNFEGKPIYILDRMDKNPVAFVDHRSSASNIAGNYVELKEDDRGLFFKLLLRPLDEIFNPKLKDAVSAFMGGFGRAMSIGGEWYFEDHDNRNHLTKAVIYEISLVGVGADGDALTQADYPKHLKSVPGFKNLPIADRETVWDAIEAEKRVKEFTEVSNPAEYSEFFRDTDDVKLAFADVINNKLTAIPQGIFAAAAIIADSQRKIKMTDAEHAGIIGHIEHYYKKMNIESPFKDGSFRVDDIAGVDIRTLEHLLKTGVSVNKPTAVKIVSLVKSLVQGDPETGEQGDPVDNWGAVKNQINLVNLQMKG